MSLLEKDTTRRGRVDDEGFAKLDAGEDDNKEYEVKAIKDSAVYSREAARQLPGLYYLISWKGYPGKKDTYEPALAVLHLRKMISNFHKEHPEKSTATSPPLDSAPPLARPTANIRPLKRKQGRRSKDKSRK